MSVSSEQQTLAREQAERGRQAKIVAFPAKAAA